MPKIPNFCRVSSSDEAIANRPPSPVPKIPNFAKALSGSSSSLADSSGSLTGSLSARGADKAPTGADDELEKRRPLTARAPGSMGLTPRSAAMLGPRPGDRSMRGMDALLGQATAASAVPLYSPRGAMPMLSPRGDVTPRSPRGTGRPSRRGSDECVAPPKGKQRLAAAAGGAAAAPATTAACAAFGDWLRPAVDAARLDAGGAPSSSMWLRQAVGGAVRLVGDGRSAASPDGTLSTGTLLGEANSGGNRWRVRLHVAEVESSVLVHRDALRRIAPGRGDRACVVMGESAGLEGEVLSVEGGVAVLKAAAPSADERRVRVLPVDALCRLDV